MSAAPRGKSAPASARIRVTVPGMGATIRLAAGDFSARDGVDDTAGRGNVGDLSCEWVDPFELEMAARRGHIEIAARPGGGCPLRRVPKAHVEHTAVARHELQPGVRAGQLHGEPIAFVPQQRVILLAPVPKAQAPTAASDERPAVGPVPG